MAYIRKAVRDKQIAWHEAGHAVIARRHRVDITNIDLNCSEKYIANIQTRSASWKILQTTEDAEMVIPEVRIDVKIALAGIAVDAKRAGISLERGERMKTPCLNDLTHAELLCSHIEENGGGKADELMAVLLFETVAEVEQSWAAIESVASLFQRSRDVVLTEADVDLALAA
jgi:hypothetical protein